MGLHKIKKFIEYNIFCALLMEEESLQRRRARQSWTAERNKFRLLVHSTTRDFFTQTDLHKDLFCAQLGKPSFCPNWMEKEKKCRASKKGSFTTKSFQLALCGFVGNAIAICGLDYCSTWLILQHEDKAKGGVYRWSVGATLFRKNQRTFYIEWYWASRLYLKSCVRILFYLVSDHELLKPSF